MLIAIEGIDGAGKRTQTQRLVSALADAGKTSDWISFPQYGKTKASDGISRYLNGEFGPMERVPVRLLALLYAEDRFQSLEALNELRRTCDVLVADRYVASNLAYQGARCPEVKRTVFIDWLAEIEYGLYGMQPADLTVYLDMPTGATAATIASKGAREYTDLQADLHEQDRGYLAECHKVYMDLCTRQYRSPWVKVNCMGDDGKLRSVDSVHSELWQHVDVLMTNPA